GLGGLDHRCVAEAVERRTAAPLAQLGDVVGLAGDEPHAVGLGLAGQQLHPRLPQLAGVRAALGLVVVGLAPPVGVAGVVGGGDRWGRPQRRTLAGPLRAGVFISFHGAPPPSWRWPSPTPLSAARTSGWACMKDIASAPASIAPVATLTTRKPALETSMPYL